MSTYSALFSIFFGTTCLLFASQPTTFAVDKVVDPIITERGLLTLVEDAGYPMVVLTIDFPERDFSEQFVMNLAEVNTLDARVLYGAVGKYVSFDYSSVIFNALLELEYNGRSLLYDDGSTPALNDDTYIITGILSNAEYETSGDLPDELFITTEEEITERFPFFITPEIVEANGALVMGFYEQRTQNTIHAIELIR